MHGASGFGKGTQLQNIGYSGGGGGEAREKSVVASLCISLNVHAQAMRASSAGRASGNHAVLSADQRSRSVRTCDDKRSRASVSLAATSVSLAATGPAADWHSHKGCHGIWDTSSPEKKDVGAPGPLLRD